MSDTREELLTKSTDELADEILAFRQRYHDHTKDLPSFLTQLAQAYNERRVMQIEMTRLRAWLTRVVKSNNDEGAMARQALDCAPAPTQCRPTKNQSRQ